MRVAVIVQLLSAAARARARKRAQAAASGGEARTCEAWWCTIRHPSGPRSKRLVASTLVTDTRPSTAERMFSVHVTQAKSPAASARTSESVKFISAAFSKIASQEERTESQPVRSGQPGWTHLTWSA